MWLRAYRFLLLLVMAWLIRNHHAALLQRTIPISLKDLSDLVPEAASLRKDPSPGGGVFVANKDGAVVAYAVCTMPRSKDIVGYAGTTDAIIILDDSKRVMSVSIRSSEETKRYVSEVSRDLRFLKSWTGMTAGKASLLKLNHLEFHAVAGASATSGAVARAVSRTLADVGNLPREKTSLTFAGQDATLVAIVIGGCLIAFGRQQGRRRLRLAFQIIVSAYFLLVTADFVTMKMTVGWIKAGIPWHAVPGLVALLAAAVLLPWSTRQPVYCMHICPHGAVQEWVGRLGPRRLHLKLGAGTLATLRLLPLVLVIGCLAVAMGESSLDLANIEPFDGYNVVRNVVGFSTLAIGLAGVGASFFIPKAYCRYGCPTGLVLEYARTRGPNDVFSRRDWIATGLALLVGILCWVL